MWEPGARVLDDRFRIDSVLASGSGGEVYVAEQLSLSRKVTLRVFRAQPGVPQVPGLRFDEEARRLAEVNHPAVVRVLESGQSETILFLVSEWAEGSSLSDELKGEPLLPDRALELLTQLADGLAALHQQGLLHGDLRAATVVSVKDARGEQAKLRDFGLARLTDPKAADPQATVIGLKLVRPEEVSSAGVPGDLYAFGGLAYQLLAGTLPGRPAARPLAEAAPHLADQHGLCELVMRCLEQDAALRPASAAELAKKLAKLPRPSEPTIFLEAMQRPPPVPVAPPAPAAPPPLPPVAPPAVSAAPAQAPRPLLASVATLIVAAPISEAALGPAIVPPSRRLPVMVIGGALVIAIAVGGVMFLGNSTKREARDLIERRQPVQALEIIGKAQRKQSEPNPELLALRAAALHLTGAHPEEAAAIRSLPAGGNEGVDPLILSGLLEDFGKKEDPLLRTLLLTLPPPKLQKVLEGFAQEPLSPRQWGALRFLDLQASTGSLSLAALYAASLESNDCAARKVAAKRLGQLMDDASEPALGRLRDAPREGAEKNCGQDEAQAALQALKKSR